MLDTTTLRLRGVAICDPLRISTESIENLNIKKPTIINEPPSVKGTAVCHTKTNQSDTSEKQPHKYPMKKKSVKHKKWWTIGGQNAGK
jgi:hypothetical protein